MAKAAYCPDRGDIVWIDFDPTVGREQAKRRPALVLSPRSYNKAAQLCLACPITKVAKGYPFEIPIQGAVAPGVILSDQIRCLSWVGRRAEYIGACPSGVLEAITKKLALLLSLGEKP